MQSGKAAVSQFWKDIFNALPLHSPERLITARQNDILYIDHEEMMESSSTSFFLKHARMFIILHFACNEMAEEHRFWAVFKQMSQKEWSEKRGNKLELCSDDVLHYF